MNIFIEANSLFLQPGRFALIILRFVQQPFDSKFERLIFVDPCSPFRRSHEVLQLRTRKSFNFLLSIISVIIQCRSPMAYLTVSQSLASAHNIFITRQKPREFYDNSLDDFAAGLTVDKPVVNYYLLLLLICGMMASRSILYHPT